jgi:hypothetical protein
MARELQLQGTAAAEQRIGSTCSWRTFNERALIDLNPQSIF